MSNFIPGLRQSDKFTFFSIEHISLLDLSDTQRELFRVDRNFDVIKEAYEKLPKTNRPLICEMVPVPADGDHLRDGDGPLYNKTLFAMCVRGFPGFPQIEVRPPLSKNGMYMEQDALELLSYEWIEEAVTLAKERSDGRGAGLPLPLTRRVISAEISHPRITSTVRNALIARGTKTVKNQGGSSS